MKLAKEAEIKIKTENEKLAEKLIKIEFNYNEKEKELNTKTLDYRENEILMNKFVEETNNENKKLTLN